jgi:AraC-like DNA-binding protein
MTDLVWKERSDASILLCSGAAQMADLLQKEGEHPDVFLRKTRLFIDDLSCLDKYLTPVQYVQLCFNASLTKMHSELAIKLGNMLLPSAMGTLITGLFHAPTLGDALIYLVASSSRWSSLMTVTRQTDSSYCHLYLYDRYGLLDDEPLQSFVCAYTMQSIRSVCNLLSPSPLRSDWMYQLGGCSVQMQVELMATFGDKITFNQPHFRISIPIGDLAHELYQPVPIIYESHLQCVHQLSQNQMSLLDILRSKIKQDITQVPSITQLSEALNLSASTLKRKLKSHNTSYQKMVDECRSETAYYLALDKHWQDQQIAEYLNFYDASNLRRARRRWAII